MSKKRKKNRVSLTVILVTGLSLYLIVLIVNQQMAMSRLEREMREVQQAIQVEKSKQAQLQQKTEQLNSLDYIEKSAREDLGLLKEGEVPYMTISPNANNGSKPLAR